MRRAIPPVFWLSDAGTPLLSDPGYPLVSACRNAGYPVVAIPGPCAAVAALSASGFATDCFLFAGFLPSRKGPRRARLEAIAAIQASLVFYEAPHRLPAALADMIEILGDRKACLARELTKIHEEWLHGTLREILAALQSRIQVRGEITLIVDRGTAASAPAPQALPRSIARHLEEEMQKSGKSRKEALRAVARSRGISRKEAYRRLLLEKKGLSPETPDDAKPL
jgi:16S rRNA (cytidine1402-2'-O)-methyltransferase